MKYYSMIQSVNVCAMMEVTAAATAGVAGGEFFSFAVVLRS